MPVEWDAGDVSFIMTQTIGQQLKAAREAKHLTLEKVFEATRIRIPYLQALEADDISGMPSPVQARGYLRNYAEYLGLNFEQLLNDLREGRKTPDEIIGPADDALTTLDTQPTTQTPEPLLTEEIEATVEEDATPPKPKPARRKKAVSQLDTDPADPLVKRRGRKKVGLEQEPIPAPERQPEIVEEPVAPIESEPQVVDAEQTIEPVSETKSELNDNLWQSWLNRLSSVVSARVSRKEEPEFDNSQVEPETSEPEDLSVKPDASLSLSSAIFIEIGMELRKRRELLSLHLEEVERNTHVKAHYLDALEKGAMEELPSTVQTRGMLSNYATFLDLDVDTLLLRFADALQTRHRERNPQKPARKPGQPIVANIPSIGNFIAGDMIFGIGMAVLLAGFAIWGVSRVLTVQNQRQIQPTAPSISDVLLASPDPSQFTATATLQPIGAISNEATVTIVIPTLNADVNVQVNLIAVERTYMRVVVDGKVKFEGRVVPGNAYPFEAQDQIEVLVGNGAAIRIVYNGRDLGLLGTFGQVISNIYTADEIITPTALPTVTVTNTVPPTSTIPPTSTLRPSSTPVPSKTSAP